MQAIQALETSAGLVVSRTSIAWKIFQKLKKAIAAFLDSRKALLIIKNSQIKGNLVFLARKKELLISMRTQNQERIAFSSTNY